MRVLLVSHRFPPTYTAGTEVYTEELGVHLAAAGAEVRVFTVDKDVGRRDLTLREREHRGLRVHELVQNLYYHHFRDTWDHPKVEERFGAVLDAFRPEVVHVHHLLYLSVGCLERARRAGARIVFTLHDFWLECPRFGQLVHGDGSVCVDVTPERCGTCLPSFGWRQSDAARTVGKALGAVHQLTGVDLSALARKAANARATGAAATQSSAADAWEEPSAEDAHHYQVQVATRTQAFRQRVTQSVDQFLSPSHFLAGRLVDWGVPGERMRVLASGVDRARFGTLPREPRDERLRVRFLGTLVHLKGAHVLIDAFAQLPEDLRARIEVAIDGPDTFQPAYVAELRARAAEVGLSVGGALDRDGVARALARTDVLVVPSLWFENRPLIILEALATRTPLLVSVFGGLIELVEDDDAGWRFPMGDAGALAGRLRRLIEDPLVLDALPFAGAEELLPTWEQVAATHRELYAALLSGAGA
ncbi:MAG: glycosyltransferase [Planctomycetota bacterium]|nr:glycosyltransferase [Planctomycetota bacterium]